MASAILLAKTVIFFAISPIGSELTKFEHACLSADIAACSAGDSTGVCSIFHCGSGDLIWKI